MWPGIDSKWGLVTPLLGLSLREKVREAMDDPGCAIAEPPRMSSVNSQSILVLSSIGRASKVFLKGKGKRNEDQGNFRKILNEWIKARTLRDPTYQGPFEAAAKTAMYRTGSKRHGIDETETSLGQNALHEAGSGYRVYSTKQT